MSGPSATVSRVSAHVGPRGVAREGVDVGTSGGLSRLGRTWCGTTIVACEQLNRRCFAIEIEPRYVDVAIRRWEKLTGKAATLDGKTWHDVAAERGVSVD